MGKASRDKGKRIEREAAAMLKRAWPDARRSASQAGGAHESDIVGTPYWVEVKGGRSIALWRALLQAASDRAAAGQPTRPILLYLKRDRTLPVVVMLAHEWIGERCSFGEFAPENEENG